MHQALGIGVIFDHDGEIDVAGEPRLGTSGDGQPSDQSPTAVQFAQRVGDQTDCRLKRRHGASTAAS